MNESETIIELGDLIKTALGALSISTSYLKVEQDYNESNDPKHKKGLLSFDNEWFLSPVAMRIKGNKKIWGWNLSKSVVIKGSRDTGPDIQDYVDIGQYRTMHEAALALVNSFVTEKIYNAWNAVAEDRFYKSQADLT